MDEVERGVDELGKTLLTSADRAGATGGGAGATFVQLDCP
jgi:hypothetical protein